MSACGSHETLLHTSDESAWVSVCVCMSVCERGCVRASACVCVPCVTRTDVRKRARRAKTEEGKEGWTDHKHKS